VDRIYYGGTIITMNPKEEILEAIALHKGKIVKAGSSK
jgi:predicted amidohydrolase YtcJ